MTPGKPKLSMMELARQTMSGKQPGLSVVRNDDGPSALSHTLGLMEGGGEAPAVVVEAASTEPKSMDDLLADLDTLLPGEQDPAAGRRAAMRASMDGAIATGVARRAALPAVQPQAPVTARPADARAAVDMVNLSHFLAPYAGDMSIWREGADPETGRFSVGVVSPAGFRLEFASTTVDVLQGGGTVKPMPVAEVWIRSQHRRQYPGGVVLQPEGKVPAGTYNLWRGWDVVAMSGDASPMLGHISMLCGGMSELVDYVLNWLALCVQRPGTRPEVALVFRGGQGTGKGTAIRAMLAIFGQHALHITQPRHLTGNFNSHLRNALLVFIDEGFWAGDKAGEGVLKGLITEPTLTIEMKGRDVFDAPNRLKLVFASNSAWVVPAGADERRYCVIDVPRTRAQDHAYFAELNSWLDGDGVAIFLDHLLHRDLTRFNVRAVPKTAALDRQKVEGMGALDRFILEAVDTGDGFGGDEWTEEPQRALCDAVAFAFDNYCRRTAARGGRADKRAIGKRFAEVFGCGPAVSVRTGAAVRRAWALPGITQARKSAATAFGLAQYEWGQT